MLQWDPSTEMLVLSAAADAEHAAAAVRRGELDSSLGPYPLKTHDEWVSLSRHVDEAVLRRAGLQCGYKADEVRAKMFEADQTPLGDFGKSVR